MWDLLEDALATHRLTKLVIDDKITEDLRKKVYERFPPDTKIGYLMSCPWCVSIYVGTGAALARRYAPGAWKIVGRALAASSVTGMIEERL